MRGEWRIPETLVTTELTAEQRRHAVHTVARNARDAGDLAELLDMLGLTAGQTQPQPAAEPVPAQPLRRIQKFAQELDELRRTEAAKHARRRQPAC